jgi:hypothetical protein
VGLEKDRLHVFGGELELLGLVLQGVAWQVLTAFCYSLERQLVGQLGHRLDDVELGPDLVPLDEPLGEVGPVHSRIPLDHPVDNQRLAIDNLRLLGWAAAGDPPGRKSKHGTMDYIAADLH